MGKLATFFTDDVASVREGTKGRSGRLINLRNQCLCDRFYYYQKIHHYHFAKVVECLSNDFFLSQIEIPKIINKCSDYIAQVKANPPAIKQLKEKWQQYNWG